MPRHHPGHEALLDYAAGCAAEPLALLVATHLLYCPDCRDTVALLDEVGAAFLHMVEPADLEPGSLDLALARLERDGSNETAPTAAPDWAVHGVPRLLWRHLGTRASGLRWRRVTLGFSILRLLEGRDGSVARLIKVAGGRGFPRHGHRGHERVLVLEGAFTDSGDHFSVGDVDSSESDVVHRPVADPGKDCLCLVVSHGAVRLTSPWGWLINPLIE